MTWRLPTQPRSPDSITQSSSSKTFKRDAASVLSTWNLPMTGSWWCLCHLRLATDNCGDLGNSDSPAAYLKSYSLCHITFSVLCLWESQTEKTEKDRHTEWKKEETLATQRKLQRNTKGTSYPSLWVWELQSPRVTNQSQYQNLRPRTCWLATTKLHF